MKIIVSEAGGAVGLAELSEAEGWALAQLCKRLTLTELRAMAASDAESWAMRDAIEGLRAALAEAGFAPR